MGRGGTYKQVNEQYIIQRYAQWVPCWRIARELGVSRPVVESRLRLHGVRLRKVSEYYAEKRKRGLKASERLWEPQKLN